MLATGKIADLGEAIGIVAAQSIGEPGTQLTMRTFHTGGVAGEDITHGLPRVVELFEARTPKSASLLADVSGVVRIGENEKGERLITIVADDGTELEYAVSRRAHLGVRDGSEVTAGDRLVGDEKSPLDPKKLLEIKGVRETQQYLVDEVQRVYRDQGVSIHDKHIEVIVRQMLRRVTVSEPGDSSFLPGEKVDARRYAEENRRLVESGQGPAEGRPELMGITKASLATDSWLSAASFQETTRVLTEAAIEGRSDGLEGLKENVIIGKLIPAGTGMPLYRDIRTDAPEYEPLPFYTSEVEEEMDLATWLREASSSPRGRSRCRGPRVRRARSRARREVEVRRVGAGSRWRRCRAGQRPSRATSPPASNPRNARTCVDSPTSPVVRVTQVRVGVGFARERCAVTVSMPRRSRVRVQLHAQSGVDLRRVQHDLHLLPARRADGVVGAARFGRAVEAPRAERARRAGILLGAHPRRHDGGIIGSRPERAVLIDRTADGRVGRAVAPTVVRVRRVDVDDEVRRRRGTAG